MKFHKRLWLIPLVFVSTVSSIVLAQEDDAYDYITEPDNGDTVGYACYPIGAEEDGVFFNADERFPLASTFKIIVLVEYARQVVSGQIDPAERVPLTELDRYYLPNTDGGAYAYWLNEIALDDDSTVSLEDIAHGMIELSVNANTDYLIERLNIQDGVEWYADIGMIDTDQPRVLLGDFLALSNHETGIFDVAEGTSEQQGELAVYAYDQYVNNPEWREAERARIGFSPVPVQAAYFQRFGNFGTPSDFARLMVAIYTDAFGQEEGGIIREILEWPTRLYPESFTDFEAFGTKGGSLPTILTAAYYADGVDSQPMVLTLFYRDLSLPQYFMWVQSFAQQVYELDVIASDCAALPQRQAQIGD